MRFNNKIVATLIASTLISAASAAENVRLVFEYKQGQKNAVVQQIQAIGGEIKVNLDEDNSVAAVIPAHLFDSLKGKNGIKSIEIDAPRQTIPLMNVQPQAFSDFVPYGIAMVQAADVQYQGGIKVCVMDTGYDFGHKDLPTNFVDGTSNGAGPWNVDGHGHGTHVAGTIAAPDGNDPTGLTGVLGSGDAELYIVRVFDSGGGFAYASGIAGAISDCVAGGANVVNMSLGGSFATKVEQRAFDRAQRAGVLSIAAAGNAGNATHSYPASYDSVVSVAAVDITETVADFSQRTTQVELAGPGVDVWSTWPGDFYAQLSGTSMATPHVAGVAALVWSNFPTCTNKEIRAALNDSAKDLGASGRDYSYGNGLVQAKAAYDLLSARGCKK